MEIVIGICVRYVLGKKHADHYWCNAVKLSEIVGWAKEERRAQRKRLLGTLRFAQPTKSKKNLKLMALRPE